MALRTETDQLHQQLDAANQALTTAVSPDQVLTLNQQRQDLLNQLQTNALVSQAWTDWVYVTPIVYPYPWIGVQQVHGLLLQARQLNLQNRHLRVLQQAVTVQAGTMPSAPVPAAGSAASRPPAPSESVTGVESFDHADAAALLHPSAPDAAAGSSTSFCTT